MRWLLSIPFMFVLVGCAETASQPQILAASKAAVANRESWSEHAYVKIDKVPGAIDPRWKVSAGAFDSSSYPDYRGIRAQPGTERQLRFTRDGCLITYRDGSSPCVRGSYSSEPAYVPVK